MPSKHAAPTEVKDSHCIRSFAGGPLCVVCVFEKQRQRESASGDPLASKPVHMLTWSIRNL